MEKVHWKKLTNPDYLGAYALDPDEDVILTIKSVAKERFTGTSGKVEEGLVVHFEEDKPLICNKTNAKAISKAVGSPYLNDWIGKRIACYIAKVDAFGERVEAVRVRPITPKESIVCESCGQIVKAFGGKSPRALAKYTKEKYGRILCADCAKELATKEAGTDGTE